MSKTKTIREDSIEVDYVITNDSFDYQGHNGSLTHKLPDSYEREAIRVYAEAIDEWIDVSNNKRAISIAESMLESYLYE